MMIVVRCIVSEMGFAQMAVIASFINNRMDVAVVIIGVVIMPMIQVMGVQLSALRAQQRQRE